MHSNSARQSHLGVFSKGKSRRRPPRSAKFIDQNRDKLGQFWPRLFRFGFHQTCSAKQLSSMFRACSPLLSGCPFGGERSPASALRAFFMRRPPRAAGTFCRICLDGRACFPATPRYQPKHLPSRGGSALITCSGRRRSDFLIETYLLSDVGASLEVWRQRHVFRSHAHTSDFLKIQKEFKSATTSFVSAFLADSSVCRPSPCKETPISRRLGPRASPVLQFLRNGRSSESRACHGCELPRISRTKTPAYAMYPDTPPRVEVCPPRSWCACRGRSRRRDLWTPRVPRLGT